VWLERFILRGWGLVCCVLWFTGYGFCGDLGFRCVDVCCFFVVLMCGLFFCEWDGSFGRVVTCHRCAWVGVTVWFYGM